MRRIEKNKKFLIPVISLFILILQLGVNHVYGGITVKSLIVILIGWVITIAMLMVTFSSAYRK